MPSLHHLQVAQANWESAAELPWAPFLTLRFLNFGFWNCCEFSSFHGLLFLEPRKLTDLFANLKVGLME